LSLVKNMLLCRAPLKSSLSYVHHVRHACPGICIESAVGPRFCSISNSCSKRDSKNKKQVNIHPISIRLIINKNRKQGPLPSIKRNIVSEVKHP
jgi:hypothetical protein